MTCKNWNKNYDDQKYRDNNIHSITSAYNFVPLSETVIFPHWADKVSYDRPLDKGVSGVLDLEIHNHSPLLIGNKEGDKVVPFMLPDGSAAIPGSSLRGMIRNVMEIACFGKMRIVDDKRYGVRDLHAPFYTKALTEKEKTNHYIPQSQAGWLNFHNDEWRITPCEMARVEQSLLKGFSSGGIIDNSKRAESDAKYKAWLNSGSPLNIDFVAKGAKFYPHNRGKIYLKYNKAITVASGKQNGCLVFTGQPGPQKHMEFIFFNEDNSRSFSVPEPIICDFQHIYQDSKHWEYLKKAKLFSQGIPVFYLIKNGKISSLGLSQMYRLAYQHSIVDMIEHTSAEHLDKKQLDLVELIFGVVDENEGKESLKGRVSFSHAAHKKSSAYSIQSCKTILSSPKPTYYPNYIVQNEQDGRLKGEIYQTYMDDDAQIRGWKRYPVKKEISVPKMDEDQEKSAAWSVFNPITDKLTFNGKMRFHNLLPIELGALAWCITWGGHTELRHAIGMGKSFGFGQIDITIKDTKLIPNNPHEAITLESCIQQFEQFMTENLGEVWPTSHQLQQLMAMANPEIAPGNIKALIPLELSGVGGTNQFVRAKGNRRYNWPFLVLKKYIDEETPKKSDQPNAKKWLEENIAELAQATNTPPEKVLLAKGLAERWQALEGQSEKTKIKAVIKQKWQDWWDEPNGKSMKQARKIYEEGL